MDPLRHYFDWAATALPDMFIPPEGIAPFGNPSSRHLEGRKAHDVLEDARSRCAAVLGVSPKQLYFTSGGTESNALVIHSMLLRPGPAALLVSSVEHPSVRENAVLLERLGRPLGLIGTAPDGRVGVHNLETALEKRRDARFAAIMAVNNEVGSRMDMPELVRFLRVRGKPHIHIHSDMVQALGKIPLDIPAWDLDSASFSAHKIGGPRGIGLLYLRRPLETLYTGGGQEGGIRPGTENTAGAAAMAASMEHRAGAALVKEEYEKAAGRCRELLRNLRTLRRCSFIPRDRRDEDDRFSPWIVQLSFEGIPGEVMVRSLDDAGFAVSTGSA
ncbi:MAG: aminotransferase class V-fold PLP-dependent enzyme, partial [Spirochaetaceae bacterium]|nr:aminotransferase class V-fold PLP-dependent enzyme [Spirochaetaceae bacterium]